MHDVIVEPMLTGVELVGTSHTAYPDILTAEALDFVARLERAFRSTRSTLLQQRIERQERIDNG